MKFCSYCGSQITFGEIPGDSLPRFYCESCHTIHYQNPNMIVGCLPRWQDRVLLCKRAIEPRKNLWTLPAGFLENGENVEDGAIRETIEEANANVEIVRLFSVYSLPRVGQVYLIFLAELKDLDFYSGPESSEVKLFREQDIPWDEIAFSAVRFTLENYFRSSANHQVYLGSYRRK
ncbi:MAG: NUDIX domain-containing protein [bacterium]